MASPFHDEPARCHYCGCVLRFEFEQQAKQDIPVCLGCRWNYQYTRPVLPNSAADREQWIARQNAWLDYPAVQEEIENWQVGVQRRDAPHIQRFWKAFELAFPAWMNRVEHLPLTPERRASMEKYLYCLSLTFYTRRENAPPRLELRAHVMRGEVRLDPMHQHFDDDRDPAYLESALQEIQEHFEQEWARSQGTQTLEAFLDSLILESYQSTPLGKES